MSDYTKDFGPFDGHTWINCAHQGPIPRVAAEAATEAIRWKQQPFEITAEKFANVPGTLKRRLCQLIRAKEDELILANSASYGMHLLANGLPLEAGDEVLLTAGDFPSVIMPWLGLEKKGIKVRFVEPRNHVLSPEELQAALSPKTRVFCATWVHSFSGRAIDIEAMGTLCRNHNVLFIANTTQAIGSRQLHVDETPVDAITNVGHKWLCGPYGTGFCWIRQPVMETMQYNQAYWLSLQTAEDLGKATQQIKLPNTPPTSKRYDSFGTANFFNYVPWSASLAYLLDIGVDVITQHNQTLVQYLIDNINCDKYQLLSPASGISRSSLTLLSHKDPTNNLAIYNHLKAKNVHIAFRRGNLRVSPHLYNTEEDMAKLLTLLDAVG